MPPGVVAADRRNHSDYEGLAPAMIFCVSSSGYQDCAVTFPP